MMTPWMKKLSFDFCSGPRRGFTLIELMIAVAIIAILAAVAIPTYTSYIRRSYLSEASSAIGSIKTALESYEMTHRCYTAAPPNPSAVPQNAQRVAWGDPGGPWSRNVLGVRPDAQVRFQYQVFANTAWVDVANPCGAPAAGSGADGVESLLGVATCLHSTNLVGAGGEYVNTNITGSDWYVVVAQADFDGTGAPPNTLLFSAVDDSTIGRCHELR